jgi:VIT1/CCC1 family predicted Fe2+/Mn2+ transporter
VLGANDGLVSNLSLVMGVAGAQIGPQAVIIAGLAGLLAGALSMAIGEWVSVKSAREMYEHQIRVEADEIAEVPEEEKEELALIYQAKGMPESDAQRLAERLLEDPQKALDTLAREELGVDPGELGGSPAQAAIASFLLFALGAIVPVVPFIFASGLLAVAASATLSAAALFLLGGAITLLTGRGILFSGVRQVLLGLAAAAITRNWNARRHRRRWVAAPNPGTGLTPRVVFFTSVHASRSSFTWCARDVARLASESQRIAQARGDGSQSERCE